MDRNEAMKLFHDTLRQIEKDYRQGKHAAHLLLRMQGLATYVSVGTAAANRLIHSTSLMEVKYVFAQSESARDHLLKMAAVQYGHGIGHANWEAELTYDMLQAWSSLRFLVAPNPVNVGIGRAFCEALMETDYQNTPTTGLQIPFPGPFALRVPARMFYLYDPTRGGVGHWSAINLITLNPLLSDENNTNINALFAVYRTGLDENSRGPDDDFFNSEMLPLSLVDDDMMSIGELQERLPKGKSPLRLQIRSEDGSTREVDFEEIRRLVYGTLLYLNLPNPSLVRLSNNKPVSMADLREPSKQRLKSKKKVRVGKPNWVTVLVSEDVDRIPRELQKHIVRGHWRNQAFGPGRGLRRLRWIKPFVRGRKGPEPKGEYEIEGLGGPEWAEPEW